MKFLEDDLRTCHGWAYEPCGLPAFLVLTEVWEDESWAMHGLCSNHVRACLDGIYAEFHPAAERIWELV